MVAIPKLKLRRQERARLIGSWLMAICGYLQMAVTQLPHTTDDWVRFISGLGLTIGALLMNRGVPTREQRGAMRIAKSLLQPNEVNK